MEALHINHEKALVMWNWFSLYPDQGVVIPQVYFVLALFGVKYLHQVSPGNLTQGGTVLSIGNLSYPSNICPMAHKTYISHESTLPLNHDKIFYYVINYFLFIPVIF